ncbi:MAG TPA: monofunctional biosynthetic peptidoglycan transglycosylase [Burkholderiales bacterium]|nr:monofunctional biosynthetic peptidoglycan transglycosylase [Burkholderiales bacterium]
MARTIFRWTGRLLLIAITLVLLYQSWIFVHIWWWVDHNPSDSAFMSARRDVLQEKKPDANLRHQWVSYNRISIHLKRAVVAAEDAKFLDHEGFDWDGIQKAMERNEKKGRIVAGGSTISQQLAKNLFLSSKRTPWRKIQEAIITVMLEQMMSKRRILEIYLNVIEWGESVFGCESAARYYYGISAVNLSPVQAAKLAAMVPNPRFYDRNRYARGLQRKTGIILARMNYAEVP